MSDQHVTSDQAQDTNTRWTWTTYPNTAPAKGITRDTPATQRPLPELVVPLACLHTPLGDASTAPRIERSPVTCSSCGSVLSARCHVDPAAHFWACPFCLRRNQLPQSYEEASSDVAEFILHNPAGTAAPTPVFIIVMDTCLPSDHFDALKCQIQRVLQLLPPNACVGLVTFGEMATVWELGYTACGKCYTLRGHRAYTDDDIKDYFGLRDSSVVGRFLVPLSDCEFTLNTILDDLQPDPFPVKVGVRPSRCTGAALQLAVGLVNALGSPGQFVGRVALFVGGPCTKGPGVVVVTDKAEAIRSQKDIADGNCALLGPAREFYLSIERRLIACSFAMDILIGSLDQVGLLEMSDCVNNTGGHLLDCPSFNSVSFEESIGRMFGRGMYYGAVIDVVTSRETQVCGLIGPVHNVKRAGPSVSQLEVGHGGTTAWQMSVVDSDTTLAFYFDTAVGEYPDAAARYFQFRTTYITAEGTKVMRVTSHMQPIARTLEAVHYVQNNAFDQEAAAVVVARSAVDILSRNDNKIDIARRWVDRVLVSLLKRFAQYVPNTPDSVRPPQSFSLFPSFLYHLRRSEFFLLFNISPDEMTYKRHYLNREPCDNCLTMIQPTLQMYTCEQPEARPAPLDSGSIQVDNVLMLDSFFEIIVHFGTTMDQWMKLEYHKNPEYANFARSITAPVEDAQRLLSKRFPYPTYRETEQHGSQARYLIRYLNPSTTHASGVQDARTLANPYAPGVQEIIYTDDASMQKFFASLKTAVCKAEQ